LETKVLIDANKIDAADLKKRQERLENRHDGLRELALKLLLHAELPKLELPRATLSVSKTRPKVIVNDPTALPDNAWRIERKPALDLIHELIDQGVAVPGASLSNAKPSLRITT
jgi:hypothetical protein